jgi:hypothetical protein
LSSIKQTDLPEPCAASAAAIPAGPAPTIATSKLSAASSVIAFYLHPLLYPDLAGLLVRLSVDSHAAFETAAHSAEWRASFTGYRPACRNAGNHGGYSNACACGNPHGSSVHP